jgi:hypothetical protein
MNVVGDSPTSKPRGTGNLTMKAILLAAAILLPVVASAGELAPMVALQRTLHNGASALIYFTPERDGFRVVATMQSDATETAPVLRFTSTLGPGQSTEISAPRAAGEPADAIVIRRMGDRLLVEDAAEVANAAE